GVLVLIIGGGWYWYSARNEVATDDAYTDGDVVTVAPQVSGQVVERDVTDNQHVTPGQVLVRIDPRPFLAARDQAKGQLDAAEGQLAAAQAALDLAKQVYPARLAAAQAERDAADAVLFRAQTDLKRQKALPRIATTQQAIDQAVAAQRQAAAELEQANAAVRQAEPVQQNIAQAAAQVKQLQGVVAQAHAQLQQAEINLGWTTVQAAQEGWVTKRNVDTGNYVGAGSAILSLVTPHVWISANFKETQLDRMRPGDAVDISVDAYPGLRLHGHVDSVQLGSGSRFSAFPAENATGNFVKIVQRVPVKIDIDSGLDPNLPMPLGISVEPTVHVK
ncbi:MAG TPA: HlyD family secretion protein, partial [Acetobacteraceae bacterium]|nr:HlyD family secretion protein [Acetobacteraceae bacterium]